MHEKVKDYKNLRDFPYLDSTSKLSPYLTSGMISAKNCLKELLQKFEFETEKLRQDLEQSERERAPYTQGSSQNATSMN